MIPRLEVVAFNLARKVSLRHIQDKIYEGESALYDRKTKWVETRNPRVKVGYRFAPGKTWLDMYFYTDNQCMGVVEFDILRGQDLKDDIQPAFESKLKIYEPHVAFLPKYQGLGYPSFVYGLVVSRGITLVAEGQTEAAHAMWKKVADRTGASFYYWNRERQAFTGPQDKKSIQVMTKAKPLRG